MKRRVRVAQMRQNKKKSEYKSGKKIVSSCQKNVELEQLGLDVVEIEIMQQR